MILYSEKTKMRKSHPLYKFCIFSCLHLVFHDKVLFERSRKELCVFMLKFAKYYLTLFVFLVAAFWFFFSIFLLPMTISTFLKRFSRLKQTKTEQTNPKDCSVRRNSKLFGNLQLLVISEHPWEPLIPYIRFILRTIYT